MKELTVIKRDGTERKFDKSKIEKAILKAMKYGAGIINKKVAQDIASKVQEEAIELFEKERTIIKIYDIEGLVFNHLCQAGYENVARAYEGYRAIREFQRECNTTDKSIVDLLDGKNEYWNTENSNKNAKLVTTQRDYLAGITSVDISRRFLLTPEIVQAHDEGIIHFHK